jgi:hypothetical protein
VLLNYFSAPFKEGFCSVKFGFCLVVCERKAGWLFKNLEAVVLLLVGESLVLLLSCAC